MPPDDDKSKIEELQKSLYSKSNPPKSIVKRRRLHPQTYSVKDDWEHSAPDEEPAEPEEEPPPRFSRIFKIILVVAAIFFLASSSIAVYVYLHGSNVVSPNNITLNVRGPISIGAGEVLTLDIDVTNRNNAGLELADLTVDYPDGTKSPADLETPLKSDEVAIDSLASGATVRKTVKSILYGSENSHGDIKVTLTYRVAGSNAVFSKDADYSVLIASAPVTLSINTFREITSGQDLTLNAHIVSNSTVDLHNILFSVDYPFGFNFESASPTPAFGNNVFNLGNLSAGESRDIAITGKVIGQDGEERVFHFYTGTASTSLDRTIGTIFVNLAQSVILQKPFLSSQIILGGDSSPVHPIQEGQVVHAEIDWQNNLSTPITSASIIAHIDGSLLNKSSITVNKGFYSSTDNTITWNPQTFPGLSSIGPGQTGAVFFDFNTQPATFPINQTYRKPTIILSTNLSGQRLSDANAPESITIGASSTIEVVSNLALTSSAVYSTGPFTNSGPVPPKADHTTTYTINLGVTNSFNQVDNAVVTATLPPNVKWLNVHSPNNENISYNPSSNQVTWQVGQISPGTGFVNSPRTVSFQVSLTPSQNQVGDSVDLVDNLNLKGIDNFTSSALISTNDNLTTKLITDPNYHYGNDTVVQ